jgi:GntR family transcriptional regulator
MAKTGTGKFAPVVDALRDQITSGGLVPGEWLPSEAAVMEQFAVSRYTAREAIRRLVAEGLVVVVDGKGSYVRPRRDRATYADIRAVYAETVKRGRGFRTVYHDAETASGEWEPVETPGTYRTNASVDIALALGVPEHTPLFVHDRLLGREQRRMAHRLFLPVSTCSGNPALTEHPFVTPDELYAALTAAGQDLRITEHVRAVAPTPDDAATLRVPPGAAVLLTRRVITSGDGRPLALEETRRNAEDTQLTYPLTPTLTDEPPGSGV